MDSRRSLLRLTLLAAALGVCSALPAAFDANQVEQQPLTPMYYAQSCPTAEQVLYKALADATSTDHRLAPRLLRLFFHDCFVNGCDGSVLMDGMDENPGEKDATPNQSLGGFDFLDQVKGAIEKECPATVSCADVLAIAARDSLYMLGGPRVPIGLGRLDGAPSSSADVIGKIPDSSGDVNATLTSFEAVGLNLHDMVALSGAHSVGKGLCKRVAGILKFGDEKVSLGMEKRLVALCGTADTLNAEQEINLDQTTPFTFDNMYYKNLQAKAGVLPSDSFMFVDPLTKPIVDAFAANQVLFFRQFVVSFLKMSEIGVAPGKKGEVRTNCHLPRRLTQ